MSFLKPRVLFHSNLLFYKRLELYTCEDWEGSAGRKAGVNLYVTRSKDHPGFNIDISFRGQILSLTVYDTRHFNPKERSGP